MPMLYGQCQTALRRYMYCDRVTISRQIHVLDDEGADNFAMTDIYTDVPCKLSQYGKEMQSEKRDREYWLRTDLRICLEPSYDIQPDDVLTITHEGHLCCMRPRRLSIRRIKKSACEGTVKRNGGSIWRL